MSVRQIFSKFRALNTFLRLYYNYIISPFLFLPQNPHMYPSQSKGHYPSVLHTACSQCFAHQKTLYMLTNCGRNSQMIKYPSESILPRKEKQTASLVRLLVRIH